MIPFIVLLIAINVGMLVIEWSINSKPALIISSVVIGLLIAIIIMLLTVPAACLL